MANFTTKVSVQNTSTEVIDLTWTEWASVIIIWNESDSDISIKLWWWTAVLWEWVVLSAWETLTYDTVWTQIQKITAIAAASWKYLSVSTDVATPWDISNFRVLNDTSDDLIINNSSILTWDYTSNALSYEISLDNWANWDDIWNENTYRFVNIVDWTYDVKVRWTKWKIKWTATSAISLTLDNTAPLLTTVTIASNNSTNTLAKVWDTITLTIVSNTNIQAPTAKINYNDAIIHAWVDAQHWTATYVMQSTDTEWNIYFAINFTDIAWNPWITKISTTNSSAVSFDKTAPEFFLTSIVSDNSDTTIATTWDIVTLIFTMSETPKNNPTITLWWQAMTMDTFVLWTLTYTYKRTIDGSEDEWIVSVDLSWNDLAWNVTTINDFASFNIDYTVETLTTVTIASNNANPLYAKIWDTVTLTIVASDNLELPTITIDWNSVTAIQWIDAKHFTASRIMQTWDTEWVIAFTINAIDSAWNPIIEVTNTTDFSNVWFDEIAPTLDSATRTNDTTLAIVMSEVISESTATKANNWWFNVFVTGTPWATFEISSISVLTWNNIILTVADVWTAIDDWLTVTYTKWWNWTVSDLAWNKLETDAIWVVIPSWA